MKVLESVSWETNVKSAHHSLNAVCPNANLHSVELYSGWRKCASSWQTNLLCAHHKLNAVYPNVVSNIRQNSIWLFDNFFHPFFEGCVCKSLSKYSGADVKNKRFCSGPARRALKSISKISLWDWAQFVSRLVFFIYFHFNTSILVFVE